MINLFNHCRLLRLSERRTNLFAMPNVSNLSEANVSKIMKCAALNNFSASRVQKPNLFGYAEAMPEIMSEANN